MLINGAEKKQMDHNEIKKLAYGIVKVKSQLLWNPQGTWPDDFDDAKQNPHGRPISYYVPHINDQPINWENTSGWTIKEQALDAGYKFQQKCRVWLVENDFD